MSEVKKCMHNRSFCLECHDSIPMQSLQVRYDAAQSQLAALREENRVLQKQLGDRWEDISALKETVERLADAERRNADCLELLNEIQPHLDHAATAFVKIKPVRDKTRALRAALNPNPEAASHDE